MTGAMKCMNRITTRRGPKRGGALLTEGADRPRNVLSVLGVTAIFGKLHTSLGICREERLGRNLSCCRLPPVLDHVPKVYSAVLVP
ncbi:hypothetical protein BGY98DRAFT_616073 [Russula aff. rugulosa BPL654]|nr:hypothetical protein BGY98DRAFT_616073 [Russula aff. rugulosa BPL654]